MISVPPEPPVPRIAPGVELHSLPEGGGEVLLDRARRLRLSPEALWLLEQIDGRTTLADLAARLSTRFDRVIGADEAADLVQRTLVTNGLATLAPADTARPPRLHRVRRATLASEAAVRTWARRLARFAPPALLPVLGLASAVTAAIAIGRGGATWSSPAAWVPALPLVALSLLVHEWAHAIALARAGGSPGAITLRLRGLLVSLSSDLAGFDALPRRDRVAVDIAGVSGQLVVAGLAGVAWLSAGVTPPAPALVAVLASVALNLLPGAGTDGRWLLDDLARRTPSDLVRRRVSPVRWIERFARVAAWRGRIALGRVADRDTHHLLPVFVSASFPQWSAGRLRRHCARHMVSRELTRLDHDDVARGARADEIRHPHSIRELRRANQGAVVCAMHIGPFHYVPVALGELGCDMVGYAAPGPHGTYAEHWRESARRLGTRFDVLSPRSNRDALRAVRAVQAGRMLVVFMDGQHATSREHHRADFRFMGNDLYMRIGAALLAHRAGAPIVLAASHREGLARRVVEFSDPLPPPVDGSNEAAIARTAEMYAWFERVVAKYPEQWAGWVWPMLHWRATGASPRATLAEVEAALERARRALAGEPRRVRLAADPTRANWIEWNAERLVVHGPARRVLVASPLACSLLDAAFRRARIADLPRRLGETARTSWRPRSRDWCWRSWRRSRTDAASGGKRRSRRPSGCAQPVHQREDALAFGVRRQQQQVARKRP